jgi:hypothetical protein
MDQIIRQQVDGDEIIKPSVQNEPDAVVDIDPATKLQNDFDIIQRQDFTDLSKEARAELELEFKELKEDDTFFDSLNTCLSRGGS